MMDKRKTSPVENNGREKAGPGIGGYLAEYGRIEEMVKSGQRRPRTKVAWIHCYQGSTNN